MIDIFRLTTRPRADLFFRKNDANDRRLGEIVSSQPGNYDHADIVILGCPQDEGVRRNGGRTGAALAPDAVRAQFYKLTGFGIRATMFDLGDTMIQPTLEATHDTHTAIVEQILRDGKRLVVLGGGNDVSYADGAAMEKVFGAENWIGLNIDQHFDVRQDEPRNSGTPYRQLLDEKKINPRNFYEIAFQTHAASKVYFQFLKDSQVNLISLDEFDLNECVKTLKEKFQQTTAPAVFFGFDVDAVRASDAPGVSAPSPLGLSAKEFCRLAQFAGESAQTKIIEFTEVNPNFDQDNRTAKLVAVAIHKFISAVK